MFVRGFVRSVARCVGLDEQEALERYGACAGIAPIAVTRGEVGARALVETMSELAPVTARMLEQPPEPRVPAATPPTPSVVVVEEIAVEAVSAVDETVAEAPAVVEAVAEAAPMKKKRAPRKKSTASATATPTPRARKKKPTAPAPESVAVAVAESVAVACEEPVAVAEPVAATMDATTCSAIDVIDVSVDALAEGSAPWRPTMPVAIAPSLPWRRPAFTSSTHASPSLVIDDDDPESADLEREARDAMKTPNRVSFLPPILLDRDDKSGRQGGLTLAVIILLIAATLTLSYLMRRPSVSGDGVTMTHTSHAIAHRLV